MNYKYITKLKIPIYEGMGVLSEDIKKVLTKKQFKLFNEYFGIQTCPILSDGRLALYIWDSEAVLVRIFENKLTGTQHPDLWD